MGLVAVRSVSVRQEPRDPFRRRVLRLIIGALAVVTVATASAANRQRVLNRNGRQAPPLSPLAEGDSAGATATGHTSEAAGSSSSSFDVISKWSKGNLIWLLGLVPFLLVVANVLLLSNGDLATLRVLVRNADPVNVALSVLTPLVPLVLLMVACHIIEEWVVVRRMPAEVGLGAIITGVAALMLMPFSRGSTLIVFAISFIALGIFVRRERRKFAAENRRSKVFQPSITVIVAIIALLLGGPWMPRERIELQDKPPLAGYFLSTQDDWSTLLTEDGEVVIVPSDQVVTRVVCGTPNQGRTALAILRGSSNKPGFDCSSTEPQPVSEPLK